LGISKLISLLLSVLAFAAAVGIHALICVGILGALLGYPIKRLIGRLLRAIGTKSDSKLPDYLKVAVVSVVFTPIIAFIITIASYDVENFRFLSQRFDMPLDDLLERAKEAHRLDFQVTWFLAICATLILLALEFWALHLEGQLAARGDDGDGEHKRFEFKSSLQKLAIIAAQALALVVLPGAAAGFMFAYFVVERLFRITVAYRARATVAPKAQGQRAI
jgi:energy-converting hydrogenase Eha subunit C